MRKIPLLLLLVVFFQAERFLVAQENATALGMASGTDRRMPSCGDDDSAQHVEPFPISEVHFITVEEYATFLNAVAGGTDIHELYHPAMASRLIRRVKNDGNVNPNACKEIIILK